MFLLILESLNQYGERKQNFKFHYVSINSLLQFFATIQKTTLNSIMFLLIHSSSIVSEV